MADTVLHVWKGSVGVGRVVCGWWRGGAFEVDVAAWEPRQLGPIVEVPGLPVSLVGDHDPLARHFWQVVVGCASSIQKGAHSLVQLLVTRRVFDSSLWLDHRRCATLIRGEVPQATVMRLVHASQLVYYRQEQIREG